MVQTFYMKKDVPKGVIGALMTLWPYVIFLSRQTCAWKICACNHTYEKIFMPLWLPKYTLYKKDFEKNVESCKTCLGVNE